MSEQQLSPNVNPIVEFKSRGKRFVQTTFQRQYPYIKSQVIIDSPVVDRDLDSKSLPFREVTNDDYQNFL